MSDTLESLAIITCGHRLLRIAALGVSNADDTDNDQAIAALAGLILDAGHSMTDYAIVPDESEAICAQVQAWIDGSNIDVILTTDISSFSFGESPPNIILVNEDDGAERASTVIHHPSLGYIGVVELLTKPQRAN